MNKICNKNDPFEQIVKNWIYGLRNSYKGYSGNTVDSYELDIKCFERFFTAGDNKTNIDLSFLQNLKRENIYKWLSYKIIEKKNSTKSNSRAISAIKNFYQFLKREYKIENSHIQTIKPPKISHKLPRVLSKKDMQTILNCRQSNWTEVRDIMIIKLIYCCGLRISEALSIKKAQLERHSNTIKIIGKGNKKRIVPVLQSIKEEVLNFLKICPYKIIDKESPIFLSKKGKELTRENFHKSILKLQAKTGIKFSAHSIRHSFATHMLDNDASLKVIQDILGHKSLSTTQIYTHVSMKKKVEIHQRLHPSNQKSKK